MVDQVVLYAATTVVPIAAPVIVDGAVAVADGLVVAVGRRDELVRRWPTAPLRQWDGVMLPGLVNAHTHLQYTGFAELGSAQYPTFMDWSDAFVDRYEMWQQAADNRRSAAGAAAHTEAANTEAVSARIASGDDQKSRPAVAIGDWREATRAGVALALQTGTTAFADVVTDWQVRDVLATEGVAGVAYLEILGLDESQWPAVRDELSSAIDTAPRTDAVDVGLSPHTPYTLDEPVLRAAARFARQQGLRLHVHLAEVDGEQELYRSATGPLAGRMASIVPGSWHLFASGGTGRTAAQFADACGLLGDDSHVAHGVHLGADERALLRRRGTVIALCPRSNEVVGSGLPPIGALLRERSPIAVGTDSLSSSPSLDLLADVQRLAELAADQGYPSPDRYQRLLAAATAGGARALGMGARLGALTPGRRADFAIFAVDPAPQHVAEAVVRGGSGRCVATVAGGVVRHDIDLPAAAG